jgi:hypothetical protein
MNQPLKDHGEATFVIEVPRARQFGIFDAHVLAIDTSNTVWKVPYMLTVPCTLLKQFCNRERNVSQINIPKWHHRCCKSSLK